MVPGVHNGLLHLSAPDRLRGSAAVTPTRVQRCPVEASAVTELFYVCAVQCTGHPSTCVPGPLELLNCAQFFKKSEFNFN